MLAWCNIRNRGRLSSDNTQTSFVDRYVAKFSDPDVSPVAVRRALPRLQRWQPHPEEPGYYVDRFEAEQHNNTRFWFLDVTYTDQMVKNPLAERASVTMRSQALSSYTLVDHKGRLMLNTAGDPFEPQEKKEVIWVLSVKKNVADFPDWLLDYPEVINTDAVRIRNRTYPPKSLAVAGITIDDYQEENDVEFLPLTLELHYRKATWQTFVPSRGYQERYELERTAGQPPEFAKRRIVLPDQSFPNEPQLLNKDGAWLPRPRPQDVHILKFQIPEDRPFSVLPLK
ncbi:MAG: hypothetical protein KF777_13625 [Planctomycetaceae bacterium]|nr:hypothetical protein [Planctomycetaceae bacterium]